MDHSIDCPFSVAFAEESVTQFATGIDLHARFECLDYFHESRHKYHRLELLISIMQSAALRAGRKCLHEIIETC